MNKLLKLIMDKRRLKKRIYCQPCIRSTCGVIPFMLTHKGMHAYNGNPNKNRRKVKNEVKNEVKKEVKKVIKNKPKFIKVKGRGAIQQSRKNFVQNLNNVGLLEKSFTNDTLRLINLVANPLHCAYAARFTDNHAQQTSLCMNDYSTYNTMKISAAAWSANSAVKQFLFYYAYGPCTGCTNVSVLGPSESNNGLKCFVIPVNSSGRPIQAGAIGNTILPIVPTINYAKIFSLTDSARLVACGFRINSLVDFSTDNATQFVSEFQCGSMRYGDFIQWAAWNTTNSLDVVLKTNPYGIYGNDQGGSARYDPFQSKDITTPWYSQATLEDSLADDPNFNITELCFPYIRVTFNLDISQDALSMDEMVNDYVGDLKSNDSYDDVSVKFYYNPKTSLYEISRDRDNLVNKSKIGLGTTYGGSYTLPIIFEMKAVWECRLLTPTPLQTTPCLRDAYWDKIDFFMSACQFKVWDDGHSFKDVVSLFKKVNPKNVKKGFKWGTGMIRTTKTGISDLSRALME